MTNFFNNLNQLSNINATSGDENAVATFICENIPPSCSYHIDNIGNVIAYKKGTDKACSKKVMLCAHMDEVGFIATYVEEDGTILFDTVGGIDVLAVIGSLVYFPKAKISGVIGTKAVHLLSQQEKDSYPKLSELYVDIGSKSKEETLSLIALGDTFCFSSEYLEFGDGFIKAKAIDDRVGCAVLLELMHKEFAYDTYFAFNVQEEVGLRGASVSSFSIAPDIALVIESTTAADIDGVSGAKKVCTLGGGAVVGFMDLRTVYDKELYALAFDTAKEQGIKIQTKTMVAGGNDSGAIHKSGAGVKTLAISVPTRYIHSKSNVCKKDDILCVLNLTERMVEKIGELKL